MLLWHNQFRNRGCCLRLNNGLEEHGRWVIKQSDYYFFFYSTKIIKATNRVLSEGAGVKVTEVKGNLKLKIIHICRIFSIKEIEASEIEVPAYSCGLNGVKTQHTVQSLLNNALHYWKRDDLMQASEKVWGVFSQTLRIFAFGRGIEIKSHNGKSALVYYLSDKHPELKRRLNELWEIANLWVATINFIISKT